MSDSTERCCVCRAAGNGMHKVADAWICDSCEEQIPWECKTARYVKGIGMEHKFAEKYILPKMTALQLKEIDAFMQENRLLAEQFHETHYVPESGMVADAERNLFYFDVARARLAPALQAALQSVEGPRVILHAEWISAFFTDYAYYKMQKEDGSAPYYPQYAQIVLQFRHPLLQNKSIRLDIEEPALVELMLRKHYAQAAKNTLALLERLTGKAAGAETRTYYDS